MAWIPSHQELRDHPKTRKAARKAGVSLPAMVGHLHMLWWWALDHAPDGDLSRYDADDLADAAMWEGDPEALVKALRDCGSGGSSGFVDSDGRLNDWEEYGGKYGKRVDAARKAAAARWHPDSNADAMQTHSGGNADASPPQGDRNAEERRGEETETPPEGTDEPSPPTPLAFDGQPANPDADDLAKALPTFASATAWLRSHGREPPAADSLPDLCDWIVRETGVQGDSDAVRRLVLGGTRDYARHVLDFEIPAKSVNIIAAQVKQRGGEATFRGVLAAVDAAAGTDGEYANEPASFGQYVVAVLTGKHKAGAR